MCPEGTFSEELPAHDDGTPGLKIFVSSFSVSEVSSGCFELAFISCLFYHNHDAHGILC